MKKIKRYTGKEILDLKQAVLISDWCLSKDVEVLEKEIESQEKEINKLYSRLEEAHKKLGIFE